MSSPPPLVRLFEPGKIGAMELKNRLIMAPMMSNQAHDGYISDEQIAYYAERARGGVGMVTCGAARASYSTWNRRSIAIYDDKFIPGLRRLTEAIHAGGAKACIQLNQLGVFLSYRRRAGIDTPDTPEELDVMGPSHVPWVRTGYTPREATKEDIQREVAFLVAGSRRAKEAGFDAVEFHGAHGYLIGAFLSPFYNRRIDEYGGTTEKRARFACEILRATRQAVGPDFPLIFRMNGSDCMEGGITIEESRRQAPLLVAAGADALHVSASSHETTQWQFLPYLLPDGAIVYLAEAIKKVVTVPVITVGKLGDPVLAEKVLAQHQADFIAWGRPLLADPALPSKVKEGRLDDINRCICCNLGCISRDYAKFPSISCVVNPATGREQEFAIRPARRRKQVMVVGGGLAGMEAARVMAERGHEVTLYERSQELGGQWNIACLQREKAVLFGHFRDRLVKGLKDAGVTVNLGQAVDRALVEKAAPEAVVVATGARPATLPVPGADGRNVVQGVDVIRGQAKVGDRVVVAGARYLGMEVAISLAEQGKTVSLVTRSRLGRDVERNTYLVLRGRLEEVGVRLYPNSPVYEIRPNGVYVAENQELLFLEADIIVLAVGARSENGLWQQLRWVVPQLYAIGDCAAPRDGFYAVREGAEIGRSV